MKGMFEFMRKVKKDKEGVYESEKNLVMENRIFIAMLVLMVIMLVTPWGRWIIKWVAYIGTGIMMVGVLAVIINNWKDLKKSCRYSQKLEKLGTSREAEEKARRWICKVEGDDGFPPMSEYLNPKKVVYLADVTALSHYADALYGCYLAQSFQPKYMKLPDDAVVYTTNQELNKLCKLEAEAVDKTAPYFGYTGFIRANCKVVDNYNPSNEENLITTILKIQDEENVSVVLLSTSEKVKEMATENNLSVINPTIAEEHNEENPAE